MREELIHLNNHKTKDDQFWANKQNEKADNHAGSRIEEKPAERKLESFTLELKGAEDKKHQVQIVGKLSDEIKILLKDIPKQKNNYRRQMLLMFHEALKQNYTKSLFSKTQVKALIDVARLCGRTFVSKEQYFKMDDILCECGLDMMPDWE